MANSNRDEVTTVGEADDALRRARELGFFRFVALLERLAFGARRIGGDGPSSEEPIHFRHDPALTFSASDIIAVRALSGEHPRFEVTTTFLGLTGAVTPLPLYFSEEIAGEDPQQGFLDLFHHRLLSLLYRAFIKYQVAAEATETGVDAWARRLLSLAGIDAATQKEVLEPSTLLGLAPALVYARRSPVALGNALAHVLDEDLPGVGVHVEPLVGQWAPLDPRDLCRLGEANHRLGANLVLGTRLFDRAGRFRIELGPVDAREFRSLGAGSPLRARIDAVVALFVNDWLTCDVAVIVDQTRQRLTLSARGLGARLGIDSWLGRDQKATASVRLGTSQQRSGPLQRQGSLRS
jgi:type VI secretion system protein ImpH